MIGLNKHTGQTTSGIEHIKQCIQDILTTRKGSRLMRREYGSYIPLLIDSAMNEVGVLRLKSAIVTAVIEYEPRVKISNVDIDVAESGQAIVSLSMKFKHQTHTAHIPLPASHA